MESFKAFKIQLNFNSPLHISKGKTGEYDQGELMPGSDTLKSALFIAAKKLYGNKINGDFFEKFNISSAFPFIGERFFYPKPMKLLPLKFDDMDNNKESSKINKKLKKLSFIEESLFIQILNSSVSQPIKVSSNQISKNGMFLTSVKKKMDEIVFQKEIQQRVNIPIERDEDPLPYYIERIHFHDNAGLFILLRCEEQFMKELLPAIKLLGENGIGTDKNVGMGQFAFNEINDVTSCEIPVDNSNKTFMLLSKYLPTREELIKTNLQKSAYQLQKRGGYITGDEKERFTTFRKSSIYMFTEGSVLQSEVIPKGKIEDLNPGNINGLEHPIWRDGTAFAIPINPS